MNTNIDRLTHKAKVYCAVRKIKLLEQAVDVLRQAHVSDVEDRQVADLYVSTREALDRAEVDFRDLRSKNTELVFEDTKQEILGKSYEEAEKIVARVVKEHHDDTYSATLERDLREHIFRHCA